MSDAQLPFDEPVEPPRPKRRRRLKVHPDDFERVPAGDERWRMIATTKGVDSVAHIFETDKHGIQFVLCGLVRGRPLSLQSTRPVACPTCRKLSA